ncbi:SNF2 family DNA-dependent ATPase, partial [Mycena olivaceomarginata]
DTSRDGPHGTPNRIPLQNSNSPVLPEAGGSNLKKRARTLDLSAPDASFLSSSLSSSPAALGGFQLKLRHVGGHDQEERMADFVTRSIENLSEGLTVKEAMRDLGLQSQMDLLPGLEVRLMPHQAIGVAWMLQREKSDDKGGNSRRRHGCRRPQSLGKTVQMIATMAMNLPGGDEEARTTLIVVPAALLQQIETKTNEMFSVRLHHGKDKVKKASEVKDYDVIITTYQTPQPRLPSAPSHGARFYRVIADEAQYIRNRSTKASLSLAHVRAKLRWMLTGTPVTNTLFARVQTRGRARWRDSAPQLILKPLLLCGARRTRRSREADPPLPPKDIEIVRLQFTHEEREIYDSFEKRSKISLNRFIRAGTLILRSAFLASIIAAAPVLTCTFFLERGRATKLMGKSWVEAILRRPWTNDDEEDAEDSANCPVCKDLIYGENGRVLPCGHEICFDCTLDLSNSPIAHDGIFGEGSEKQNLAVEKAYEDAAAKALRPCPTCHKMTDLKSTKVFKSSAFEPTEDELEQHSRSKRALKRPRYSWGDDVKVRAAPQKAFEDRKLDSDSDDDMPDFPLLGSLLKKEEKDESISTGKKGKGVARSPRKRKAGDDEDEVDMPSDAVISNWGRGDDDLEPSTKMLAMMGLLKEWEVTGDKTICYSQWTSMLDLIEILFSRHGIRSLRFDGKMDRAQRDAVLATFKRPGGPKSFLLGLNVWVKRLVVENTIEERMLQLQDVKSGLSDAALGEGTGGSLHKMSVKDIKQLFGMADH